MSDSQALSDGGGFPKISRRSPAPTGDAIGRVITGPAVSHARTVRVSDDANFLGWLDRAREALPIESGTDFPEAPSAVLEATAAEELARSVAVSAPKEEPEPVGNDEIGDDPSDIPEAIVLKRPGSAAHGPPRSSSGGRDKRNMAGDVVRAQIPDKRDYANAARRANSSAPPLDTGRFLAFEEYNEGQTRVAPLKRGNAIAAGERRLKRPKFLDGKLPRSVERGVLHPQPVRLFCTSVLVLITKLLLIAVLIAFPVAAVIDGRTLIPKLFPLFLSFLVVGAAFIYCSNKTRCRVCSCHFFYVRRCHKHRNAHRIPFFGMACTGALHLLFFKWMRCMYCGTAIRLRGSTGIGKPTGGRLEDGVIEAEPDGE